MDCDWVLLRSGALGDLVLSIQLMLRCPAVREAGGFGLCASRRFNALADANPRIEQISVGEAQLDWLFSESDAPPPPQLCAAIAGKNVVNLLHSRDRPHALRIAALGPRRLFDLDPRPLPGAVRHIIDQWQSQLARQGMSFEACARKLQSVNTLGLPDAIRERGAALLGAKSGHSNPIVIHPGSGSVIKNWPLENFVALASRLHDAGSAVAFVVGEVEQERWSPAGLEALKADFPLLIDPPMDGLIAILTAAAQVIGNDSGPLHLAALLGTPTVSLFGPTDARIWRPLGPRARTITGKSPEAADWGIQVEEVVVTALR